MTAHLAFVGNRRSLVLGQWPFLPDIQAHRVGFLAMPSILRRM
jgi:hypothetical protein